MKSRTISRRGLNCALLGALALASLPLPAQVQPEFPSKAVTIILSYPPGSLGDSSARRLAQRLSEMWKVPVLVDSKPGAAGLLGAGIVAKAPADGHTILYIIPETLSVAIASADRISQMPAVPTIAESGIPGYDAPVALATMVRAGTPRHIVDQPSAAIRKVMHEPAMLEWLAQISTVTSNLTPDEIKARMQREIVSYQRILEKVGPQKFTE